MFNLKRNQIIITVLVFMIAIAAYLNTQTAPMGVEGNYVENGTITGEPEETDFFQGDTQTAQATTDTQEVVNQEQQASSEPIENEKELTMAQANSEQSFTAVIQKKSEEEFNSENVAVSKSMDTTYFSEEKLLREQSRTAQIEQLTEYVANENLDEDSKSKAAANLLEIQERIEKESSAEALLRAKGFAEVYVRIDDDTVDVVVNKAELSDSDIAQIEEVVNRKTGYSVGKINITPLNGMPKAK